MNFRHLRAFVAVAEELSFTKAARRLHISQPPLSRQIQQLERDIGVRLFDRGPRRIALTDRGRLLLDDARRLGTIADAFVDAAQRVKRKNAGMVRIGIAWGLWKAVYRIRTLYAKEHPAVEITGEDLGVHADSLHPVDAFRRQRIDVALTRAAVDGRAIECAPLFHERITMLVREDHPLARSRAVGLPQLIGEPLLLFDRRLSPVLYDTVLGLYAAAGLAPRIVHTQTSPMEQAGLMLVASGEGIYPSVSGRFTQANTVPGIAALPLTEAQATIPVLLAWRSDERSAPVLRFVEVAQAAFGPPRRPVPPLRRRG